MERNTGEAEDNLNTSDFTSFDDFIQLFKTAMIITKTSEQHQSNRALVSGSQMITVMVSVDTSERTFTCKHRACHKECVCLTTNEWS